MGVNVTRAKLIAFAAGAFVAGIGGALCAHYALYIQYSDFGADKALALLTYAVFGGIDVWFGGILGAAVLSYLPVLLQVFDHWRLEIHGAIILGVMAMRPQGVLSPDLSVDTRA
jgi:branched-chain amino acid transport system permease protein